MTDAQNAGLYVYGVVGEPVAAAPLRSPGVGAEEGVEFMAEAGLWAAFSRVPIEDFSQERVRDLLKAGDTRWMEEKALAHATVLQELMQRGPVIPMRFGILFHDMEGLRARLSPRKEELQSLLDRLSGKLEWGVKVFGKDETLRGVVLEQDPEARSLGDRLKRVTPGAAYLLQKKLDLLVKGKLEELLSQWAEQLHKALAEVSWEATMLEIPGGQERLRQDERIVLNSAHLVWQQYTARFTAHLEELGRNWNSKGLRFDLSGPWPPYHFAHLDLQADKQ